MIVVEMKDSLKEKTCAFNLTRNKRLVVPRDFKEEEGT
jgi:hypothetical protein